MSAEESTDTPEAPDCDEDAALVASLRSAQRVVVVQPWMVAELGIAAIWFAQLLWRMETYGKDVIVRSDHEWEAETGLNRNQVLRARQLAASAKHQWITVTIRKSGGTPKPHIRLNVTRLAAVLRAVHCANSRNPGEREFAESFPLSDTYVDEDPYGSSRDCADEASSEPVTSQSTEPQPPVDETPRRLCNLFADLIEQRGNLRPLVSRAWLADMERLLRIDHREPAEIEGVMRWLHAGQDQVSSFWQPNIRSPKKLREKWDQMSEQHRRRRSNGNNGTDALRWLEQQLAGQA